MLTLKPTPGVDVDRDSRRLVDKDVFDAMRRAAGWQCDFEMAVEITAKFLDQLAWSYPRHSVDIELQEVASKLRDVLQWNLEDEGDA